MKYIADLHVHSQFSRATSKACNLPGLFSWAQVKGVNLVGTGDFTHPGWFAILKENLAPAESGFFRLKDENVNSALKGVSPAPISVRFILTAEISCIYKRNGRVRKIHTILHVPDFESAEKINTKLAAIGNIESDGRPILGLDVRDLLEILLEQAPEGFMVPAHIWTPWFSLFGSRSGFDTVEECFGDLTQYIFALETGLSSDPDMNRLIQSLDRFTLISNSDCHSPSKLGREANLFDTGFDFYSMRDALKNNRGNEFTGTVEFFPEEGKYHFDGHRKCNVCIDPADIGKSSAVCQVCGNPLTVGVMHRVIELADRKEPCYKNGSPIFKSLVPLPEVLSEIVGVGPSSKRVLTEYARVISLFGSDLNLYLNVPIEEIKRKHSTLLSEAVKRIRNGNVIRTPGYDGEYGVIKVFNDSSELNRASGQLDLFS
ncbi:MAG: endonuclease Q family protein [Candidatus Anammoxibacter sp.]